MFRTFTYTILPLADCSLICPIFWSFFSYLCRIKNIFSQINLGKWQVQTPQIAQVGFGSNLIRHLVTFMLKLKFRPKVSQKADKTKKHWKFSWVENNSFAIYKLFGKSLKFYSNLNILKNTLSYFASFYKDILKLWSKYYSNQSSLPSNIISQYLWLKVFIKIDNIKLLFLGSFWEKKYLLMI